MKLLWIVDARRQCSSGMNETRVLKLVSELIPNGRRTVGRPKKRWSDQNHKDGTSME